MRMKSTGRTLAAAAALALLSASGALASEFEVVADSFTATKQVNKASATYMGAMATAPGNPDTSTQLTTPGALYFDGSNYKVWERGLGAWVNVATGTVVGGAVTGSGTANTVTKWTASGAVGNSNVTDDGTDVTVAAGTNFKVGANVTIPVAGGLTVSAGTADILGFQVTKSGNVTTLRNGAGTALVNIK